MGLSDEEDELANARLQFRLLDEKLTDATHVIENVSKARRNLAAAHADAGDKIAAFSTTEDHPPLAEGLKKLARSERAFADVEANASVGEMVTLSDGFGWCAVQSRSSKDVLKNRTAVLEEHHASAKRSIEKRRNIERIKAATSGISADKVDAALEELEEARHIRLNSSWLWLIWMSTVAQAKKVEEVLAARATAISTNLRPALRTHSKHLHDDLLYALMEHARTQTIYERQILKELEMVRPEIASIPTRDAGHIYIAQPTSSATASPAVSSPAMSFDRRSSTTSAYSPRPGSPASGHGQARFGTVGSGAQSMYAGHSGHGDPLSGSVLGPGAAGGGRGMINTSANTVGRSNRINDMARSVLVTQGEKDRRQAVDARSAAQSLARLF